MQPIQTVLILAANQLSGAVRLDGIEHAKQLVDELLLDTNSRNELAQEQLDTAIELGDHRMVDVLKARVAQLGSIANQAKAWLLVHSMIPLDVEFDAAIDHVCSKNCPDH